MREPVDKVIDGETYTFCQLPPKKSLKLLTRLLRIIGPTVGAAMEGIGAGNLGNVAALIGADIDLSVIVTALCDRLDENEVEAIIDTLLSQVIHNGQGEVSKKFDALFGGRLPHLFKVVGEALRVEYGDFLAGMPDLSALGARAGMTPAKPTSTGTTGDRS